MEEVQVSLLASATDFINLFFDEEGLPGKEERLAEIVREIELTETYTHTPEELEFGAKVAWRNSNRCIGRLFWKTLKVRDMRHLSDPELVFKDLQEHLDYAWNDGKIRSAISVYRPAFPGEAAALRIWNPQLFRYAAWATAEGAVLGDPAMLAFTEFCVRQGWKGKKTAFDLLPTVISGSDGVPKLFTWEKEVPEVYIEHPDYAWFADLGIRWYAVPLISNMVLEIGGILYPAAPFNGWYMLTEIAVRNLGDTHRYNLLPLIAEKLHLDQDPHFQVWKDKALVVLQEAVWFSFRKAGVTLIDHHSAAKQFMKFTDRESAEGRAVTGDWSWLIPPTAGSTMEAFHQEWNNEVKSPNYFYSRYHLGQPIPESSISDTERPFYEPF